MVFCFFGPLVILIYLFGHLVFYLFGPLNSVYWTSSQEFDQNHNFVLFFLSCFALFKPVLFPIFQLQPPPSLSTTGREYSLESGYNSTSNSNSNPCSPGSRPGTRNAWGRASSKSVSDASSPKGQLKTR